VKTLGIWLALVVVGIGAALYFGRSRVETGTGNRPWPLGLGLVADAPKRYPATKDNAAAVKLIELARKADVDLRQSRRMTGYEERRALMNYVREQLERSGDAIDAPPADIAEQLEQHAAALDEIRAHVLSAGPIVFASDATFRGSRDEAPGPNLVMLQHLQRQFVVRALVAARDGNPEAWDELRVVWELARPLWGHPESMSVLTASTAARMVNTAARKMPLPPPAWFAEIASFPYERALVSVHQVEAWRGGPGANVRLRGMADAVLRAKACDRTSPQFEAVREELGARDTPNLVSAWERLMRFRAEREATQRVLQMRAGQTPSRDSQCADGSWEVTATSFKFTREAPVEPPQIEYPLQYARSSPAQSRTAPPAAPAK
jgi:hypothetical protein